jgi:hypothetical protein
MLELRIGIHNYHHKKEAEAYSIDGDLAVELQEK